MYKTVPIQLLSASRARLPMQAWHSRPIRLGIVPAPTGATNFSNLRSINVCHQLRRSANVARRFGTKRFVKVGPILAFDTLIQWQR